MFLLYQLYFNYVNKIHWPFLPWWSQTSSRQIKHQLKWDTYKLNGNLFSSLLRDIIKTSNGRTRALASVFFHSSGDIWIQAVELELLFKRWPKHGSLSVVTKFLIEIKRVKKPTWFSENFSIFPHIPQVRLLLH